MGRERIGRQETLHAPCCQGELPLELVALDRRAQRAKGLGARSARRRNLVVTAQLAHRRPESSQLSEQSGPSIGYQLLSPHQSREHLELALEQDAQLLLVVVTTARGMPTERRE